MSVRTILTVVSLAPSVLIGPALARTGDAEIVACQRPVQGTRAMTIYKPVKQLAPRAAEIAVAISSAKPVLATATTANGSPQIPSVLFPSQVVTENNVDATQPSDN